MQKKFTPEEETQFGDVPNGDPEQQKPFIDAFSKMNLNMEKLLKQLKTSEKNEYEICLVILANSAQYILHGKSMGKGTK